MKKLNLLLFVGLLSSSLLAQENSISMGEATITIDELRDHIYYLASDELEGRFPGTPGFNKSLEYVITQFRQAGLTPICKTNDSKLSYYQEITINKYSPGTDNQVTIVKNVNERTFTFEDNYITICGNPFEIKELSGGLVFIGAGIREPEYGIDDYKNIDVKGKWVVVLPGEETFPMAIKKKLPLEILQKYKTGSSEKWEIIIQNANDAGAIGVISLPSPSYPMESIAGSFHDKYVLPGFGRLTWDYSKPILIIDSSMVNYLFNGEKYNPIKNKESYKTFILRNTEFKLQKEYDLSTINTANNVALIEGSDPILKNEYIILGAHIDHLGILKNEVMNGADDNASGCAAVLEIAEALAKSKLKRSVICILFTGEELGLLGSLYFTENPPIPLKDIIVSIDLDMIGCSNTDVNGLAPIGIMKSNPRFKEIILKVSERNPNSTLDWAYESLDPSISTRSDHYPFHLKKIPAICFFSGFNSDYHSASDDVEKIDYEFFQNSCKFVYEVILELTNGDINLKE